MKSQKPFSQLPLCCNPTAFALMKRQIECMDSHDALLNGAIAVAMHQMDNVDPAAVDRTIQTYADTVRKRVKGSQKQAVIAHLHEYLFDELKFNGSSDDYYDPKNSYLPSVIKSKRGLPITLSLLYKLVGDRLGLRVHGIGLPGHFLCAVETEDDGTAMLIDPFGGG